MKRRKQTDRRRLGHSGGPVVARVTLSVRLDANVMRWTAEIQGQGETIAGAHGEGADRDLRKGQWLKAPKAIAGDAVRAFCAQRYPGRTVQLDFIEEGRDVQEKSSFELTLPSMGPLFMLVRQYEGELEQVDAEIQDVETAIASRNFSDDGPESIRLREPVEVRLLEKRESLANLRTIVMTELGRAQTALQEREALLELTR